ncbi:MAG: hypothetical protein IPK34_01805 [Ramlibacter sp.]|jgi:hypothetical protein|nr:hypothetical protein [Ramlibacter sp.]
MPLLDSEHIDAGIRQLGLAEDVVRLERADAEAVVKRAETAFLDSGGGSWWDRFHEPTATAQFEDDRAFERLATFSPSPDRPCYLIVDVEEVPAVYLLKPDLATRVLAESPFMEYCLVGETFTWLLCENHHGALIGCGTAAAKVASAAAA